MRHQQYIVNEDTLLEYNVYGKGANTLICFHGFGQDASVFESLATVVPNYRLISITLFFHGNSIRNNASKYLLHKEWKSIFTGFLKRLDIQRFAVLGYSLGGRYVASTIHSFSGRIDHCILIAADGLVKRFWYEFATFPGLPQYFFRYMMEHPKPFFRFLDWVERNKIMNTSTVKFSRTQLQTEEQRLRVLRSWITLRKLRLTQRDMTTLINKKVFKTTLIFGEYDRVIDPRAHEEFINKLTTAAYTDLPSRHHELIEKSAKTVALVLNN